MKNEFWFYIDSFIHISVKKNNALLYHPYTGQIIEYKKNPQVIKLLVRLLSPLNLRVVAMTDKELSEPVIKDFVNQIKNSFMGDLLNRSFSDGKPVQMPPYLKIQKDTKYLKTINGRPVGEKVMDYLSELILYLNEQCSQECHLCNHAYRQFLCCHCPPSTKERNHWLDIGLIENLLEELNGCRLANLNILGGNILYYPELGHFTELLKRKNLPHTYFVHYLNIAEHDDCREQIKKMVSDHTHFMVPVSFPLDDVKFRKTFEILSSSNVPFRYLFIIENIDDFDKAKKLQTVYQSKSPLVRICYNGKNRAFFEKYVYVDRTMIENQKPSWKTIYINGSVNRSNFGKLTILPNGNVYANVNNPKLGKVGKDSIYDMVQKEMTNRRSWRKIRKFVAPCKSCVFDKLCPPLSDYNTALGRNNLCQIKV